jgi:hypothetical protein
MIILTDALRHYIVRVAASARRKDAKSAALAHAPLAPVQAWQAPSNARTLDAPPEPATPAPAA